MTKIRNIRKSRRIQREKRHRRIRKKIWGSADRPRLVVFRSLKNIEGQLVDDDAGQTIVGLSTLNPELRAMEADEDHPRMQAAREAGKLLAEKAKERGIESVVFDRGGYKYHGRVKAFAEGAREGGLKF